MFIFYFFSLTIFVVDLYFLNYYLSMQRYKNKYLYHLGNGKSSLFLRKTGNTAA